MSSFLQEWTIVKLSCLNAYVSVLFQLVSETPNRSILNLDISFSRIYRFPSVFSVLTFHVASVCLTGRFLAPSLPGTEGLCLWCAVMESDKRLWYLGTC